MRDVEEVPTSCCLIHQSGGSAWIRRWEEAAAGDAGQVRSDDVPPSHWETQTRQQQPAASKAKKGRMNNQRASNVTFSSN